MIQHCLHGPGGLKYQGSSLMELERADEDVLCSATQRLTEVSPQNWTVLTQQYLVCTVHTRMQFVP